MAEKQDDVMQPLLTAGKPSNGLDFPVTTVPQPQLQSKWKRFARLAVVLVATGYLVKSSLGWVGLHDDEDWFHYDNIASGHQAFHPGHGPHSFPCDNATAAGWITLDKAYFKEPSTLSYNITTSAPFIKIISRGPVFGNITIESGGTKGDDIEVDVDFVKGGGCGRQPHGGPGEPPNRIHYGDEPHSTPAHPPHRDHPHHPWTPPKVKVCSFYTDNGQIKGIGIFAYRDHHDHHEKADFGAWRSWGSAYEEDDHHPHPHPGPGEPDHPPHGPPRRRFPWRGPHRPPGPPAHAVVHIRFPSASSLDKKSPLALDSFETSLPGFTHFVKDLSNEVSFNRITLFTLHRPVFVKSLTAKVLNVLAIGGPIFGTFEASQWLDLVSVDRPVGAKVTLTGAGHEKWGNGTGYRAVALGSFVYTNVTLIDTTTGDEPSTFSPAFFLKTVTSDARGWTHPGPHGPHDPHGPHGPPRHHWSHQPPAGIFDPTPHHPPHQSGTIINFLKQPTNSTLVVLSHARGPASPVLVRLQPAFQGAFDLFSLGLKPTLEVTEGAKDPSGEGRTRVITKRGTWSPWKVAGFTKWVKEDKGDLGNLDIDSKPATKGHLCGLGRTTETMEETLEEFHAALRMNDGEDKPHDAFGRAQIATLRSQAKLVLDADL